MLTMFNQEISGRLKRQPLFLVHIDCSGYTNILYQPEYGLSQYF